MPHVTPGLHAYSRLWQLQSLVAPNRYLGRGELIAATPASRLNRSRLRCWVQAMQPAAATSSQQAAVGVAGGPSRQQTVKLAVVGDVHGQWDADSEAALLSLGADVAVFLGDFGEEDCQLVERIAAVQQRKVVVLGNHDAWYSLTDRGRVRLARKLAQSNSAAAALAAAQGGTRGGAGGGVVTPAVRRQLEVLGEAHIGYRSAHFEDLGISLVGARPFSKGGNRWSDMAAFYREAYQVGSLEDSARRIVEAVLAAGPSAAPAPAGAAAAGIAPAGPAAVAGASTAGPAPAASTPVVQHGPMRVLVAHNGPTGLGARRQDICGVDWMAGQEGDHGDPDLEAALRELHAQGAPVPLVLFGHMHSGLKFGGRRNMVHVDTATGTIYVNCAVVPRIREFQLHPGKMQLGEGRGAGAGGVGGAAADDAAPAGGLHLEEESGGSDADVARQGGQAAAAGTPRPRGLERVRSPKRGREDGQGGEAAPGASGSGSGGAPTPASEQQQQQQKHQQQQRVEQGDAAVGAAGMSQQQQGQQECVRGHHFVVVELAGGAVVSARNVWVGVTASNNATTAVTAPDSAATAAYGSAAAGRRCVLLSEEGLLSLQPQQEMGGSSDESSDLGDGCLGSGVAGGQLAYRVYRGHEGSWHTVCCPAQGTAAPTGARQQSVPVNA